MTPDGAQAPENEEKTDDDIQAEEEQLPELAASIRSSIHYLFVGEGGVSVTATVRDGVAPFTVELRVSVNGETRSTQTFHLADAGIAELTYYPENAGDHVATAYVTDAAGRETSVSVTTPVAVHAVEYPASWEKSVAEVRLSGDWRQDLVAIAQSQLGYQESRINFVIEDGVRRGYTRYGDWYGAPYAQWCGMFVAFCQEYAGIPAKSYPQAAGVSAYMDAIDAMDALEDSDYMPERGDLVFFMWENEETPSHMGIVENVDGVNLYTIEGNSASIVQRRSYSLYSDDIIGYANTKKLMERAGVAEQKTAEPDIELSGMARTTKDSVNMRSQPSQDSAFVRKVRKADTRVTLLGAADQGDMRWYLVKFNDAIGYIRGDLLEIQARADEELLEELPHDEEETGDTETTGGEEDEFFDPDNEVETVAPSDQEETEEELFFGDVEADEQDEEAQQANSADEQGAESGEESGEEPEGQLSEDQQSEEQEEELFFGMSSMMSLRSAAPAGEETEKNEADPQDGQADEYVCGLSEHVHDAQCVNEGGEMVCTLTEHEHEASCLTASEEDDDESLEDEAEFAAALTSDAESFVLGESARVSVMGVISGGAAPYMLTINVYQGEALLQNMQLGTESGEFKFYYAPDQAGEYVARVTVTDALEAVAESELVMTITDPDAVQPEEADQEYVCGLEAHVHGEECYDESNAVICGAEEHEHSDACLAVEEELPEEADQEYVCGLEAHAHGEECYDESNAVICGAEEHEHSDACLAVEEELPEEADQEYVCGLEAHAHGEECYDESNAVICGAEEHEHSDACLTAQEEMAETPETEYLCGNPSHMHAEECYDENEALVCGLKEHEHSEDCLKTPRPVRYICGLEAHVHNNNCLSSIYTPECGMDEHVHGDACIMQIDPLSAALTSDAEQFVLGESMRVVVDAAITGGYGPYAVTANVYQGDVLLQSAQMTSEEGAVRFFFVPELPGEYSAEITVTDADGFAAQTSLTMTIAAPAPEYFCGKEEHTHGEKCFDEQSNLICEVEEHAHDENCLIPPVIEEPEVIEVTPDENGDLNLSVDISKELEEYQVNSIYITYGLYEGDTLIRQDMGAFWDQIAELKLKTSYSTKTLHDGEYVLKLNMMIWGNESINIEKTIPVRIKMPPTYYCGLEEHTHVGTCYDDTTVLVCGKTEHAHDLYCTAEPIVITLAAEARELDYNDPFEPVLVSTMITGGAAPYTVGMHVRAVETEQIPAEDTPAETGGELPADEQEDSGENTEITDGTEEALPDASEENTQSAEPAALDGGEEPAGDAGEDTAADGETYADAADSEPAVEDAPKSEPTEYAFTFLPEKTGMHTVIVKVTDADGREAQAEIAVEIVRQVAAWEESLMGIELTGDSSEDVLAVARSQIGYEETVKAPLDLEDAAVQVVTRYGDWYGEQRDNWSSLFASFVLHYANLTDFPLSADAAPWAQMLADRGLYHKAAGYMPQAGDLVFLDTDGDGTADDTALVDSVDVSVVPFRFNPDDGSMTYVDTEASSISAEMARENPYNVWMRSGEVHLIAGDVDGMVAEIGQDATDSIVNSGGIATLSLSADSEPEIIGYASVSENEKSKEVAKVIAMIDAMPSADEYDALVYAYDETESDEDYAALMEAYGRVETAYNAYMNLLPEQRAYISNIDKFMELEYVWSSMVFVSNITSDTPTVVNGVSTSDFVELNLYDYTASINDRWKADKNWPGFQWNGGAYMTSYAFSRTRVDNIDFGNSMITDLDYGSYHSSSVGANGYSRNRVNVVNQGGTINTSGDTYTNKPTGLTAGKRALNFWLSEDGYPVLLSNGGKLDWLFSSGKKNTANIDGLFQRNATSGEYYYDSRDNHAQYSNNRFTLYNQIITPNFILYPFGNFLPLNDITNGLNATQVSKITTIGTYVQRIINDLWYDANLRNQSTGAWYDATAGQLVDMLAKYRTNLQNASLWESANAKQIIQEYLNAQGFGGTLTDSLLASLYNIDWDVDTNFFFGMDMRMNFMQPKNGMTGTNNAYPMKFYFAGDDDVWVYIDDILFLDLTGIHRHVGGDIDFVNGKVNYYDFGTYVDGAVSSSASQSYTFEQILTMAGVTNLDKYLKKENGVYTTFHDYSTHTFDFFYMERGSGSSVCRINFNFPLLKKNAISVMKELTGDVSNAQILGNPDYKFQVLKANANGSLTNELFIAANTPYDIYEGEATAGKEPIGSGVTDANGIFTLKAGQSAEFTGIQENAGKYYVRELLDGNELLQYGKITVSGNETTRQEDVVIGGSAFTGVVSPVKDMSDGTTAFRFINNFEADMLGQLSITKEMAQGAIGDTPDKVFQFEVKLDNTKLPVGTTYDVYVGETKTATRTVQTAGAVELKVGERIEIRNILAGSDYSITELTEDYTVTYKVTHKDGTTTTVTTKLLEGVIITNETVEILATNTVKGAELEIPVIKTVPNADGKTRSFQFSLDQIKLDIKDYDVVAHIADLTINVTSESSVTGVFDKLYFPASMADADGETYSYLITEVIPESGFGVAHDATQYLLQVTATETDEGVVLTKKLYTLATGDQGELVKLEVESGKVEFTNVLYGDLSITKQINGVDTTREFQFAVALAGPLLPGTYTTATIKNNAPVTDTRNPATITITENSEALTVYLRQDETFIIYGLPVGTTWVVNEDFDDELRKDYEPSVETTTGTVGEDKTSASGTVFSGSADKGEGSSVTFINTQLFELPSTGGPGTLLYTMGGWLLIAVSIFLLYNQRKYRKEGYET